MIRSPTKSLAQLLASNGHDEDDIFVARAITPLSSAGGSARGSADEVRGQTGIIRMDGGIDYHKLNMKIALLKHPSGNQADGEADDTNDDQDGDVVDAGSSGKTDASPDNTVAGDNDTDGADTGADDTAPAGDMTVTGTNGNDILSGGDGIDTFVFAPNGGQDIITNFDVGNDVLDLRAYGLASLDNVLSHAVSDGADLAFVIGAARIVLHDVTFAQAQDLSILFA